MNNSKRWFIMQENQVQGPYQEQEIEGLISQLQNPLIWGRGLTEWVPPLKWREALKNPALIIQEEAEPMWKYRIEDREHGPMKFQEMLTQLKKELDHSNILLWNEEKPEWRDIFTVQKVADELGVSRRAHPRVPIMGNLQCEMPDGPVTLKVISISEGGVGVSGTNNLTIGQKFKAVLSSANLFVTVNCTCEVVYVGSEGYAGIRFSNLPIEAKSAVIEYINKFKDLKQG
jgi:hypothetical protein